MNCLLFRILILHRIFPEITDLDIMQLFYDLYSFHLSVFLHKLELHASLMLLQLIM